MLEEAHEESHEQRQREQGVDDEEIAGGDAGVRKRFPDLRAVGGEDIDQDVGEPSEKDEETSPFSRNVELLPVPSQQRTDEGPGEQAEEQGVREAAMPLQLLDRIRPGEGEDVQVWQGAEEGPPGHGPPPDGTAQDDFTDGSAESGLGEGVHGEGRRIAAANA